MWGGAGFVLNSILFSLFFTNRVMSSEDDGSYKTLGLPTQPYCRIHCHQSAVRAARFNADGNYCMTAGGDKTIKLWNPYNFRLLKTYAGHGGEVSDVQVSSYYIDLLLFLCTHK